VEEGLVSGLPAHHACELILHLPAAIEGLAPARFDHLQKLLNP
jgi:hypothetical protein